MPYRQPTIVQRLAFRQGFVARYTIRGATHGEIAVRARTSDDACATAAPLLDAKYGRGNWCIRAVDAASTL